MGYSRAEIIEMLCAEGAELDALLARATAVRRDTVGESVYLRGLIEYSNVCRKNCLYCGIRRDNRTVDRYTLTRDEVLDAARHAWISRYGSVVLQGGEVTAPQHIGTIASLIREIKALSNGELGITLSLGEQSADTYRLWREAGAHRYLLRIESSTPSLYARIHPADGLHRYNERLRALHDLRATGYQVGTGVMIGLPGQSVEHLADDLLFMRDTDIDMCGMGPYVECDRTPLADAGGSPGPLAERFTMTLRMIAVLRLLMPDINIAATTALQAIDPEGRLRGIGAGANVIMPNITPDAVRGSYRLYNGKPLSLDSRVIERCVAYGVWGDSLRFKKR
ncbi:MAG: [Rikenellaceae bacterium]|nr:[FeFe] hydrogenase H-cluster radical SAM maturase HydE [Rikenellaceae bacterium]